MITSSEPARGARIAGLAVVLLASACAAHGPTCLKGPYALNVTTSSVEILFELRRAAAASVEATDTGGVAKRFGTPRATFHRVRLTGLSPGVEYAYRVRVGNSVLGEGRFRTAPAPGSHQPIRFLAYGDNRSGDEVHSALVAQMRQVHAGFVLHSGDLVLNASNEEQWQEFFDGARELLDRTVLVPIAGNHDHDREQNTRSLYTRYLPLPEDRSSSYVFAYGPVRFFMLDSNVAWHGNTAQLEWLQTALARASADPGVSHIIAVTHAGPFSSGRHGPNQDLHDAGVVALLRRYAVSLVISGHDHLYERGEREGLKYIVSGGGGAPLYDTNRGSVGQLAFVPAHHFLDLSIAGPRLDVRVRGPRGELLEACGFDRGRPWQCTVPLRTRSDRWTTRLAIAALVAVVLRAGFGWLAWRRKRRRASRTE